MKIAFLIKLSQEMKHGFTSMIRKQNCSPNSGSYVVHLVQSNSKSERSVKKVMATVFWDSKGVVFWKVKNCYRCLLWRSFKEIESKISWKGSGKLHHGILFHHDNAPVHSFWIIKDVLWEFRWKLLPHPPYSPDLTPSDFFLFPKLKKHLKGVHFNDTNEAKQAAKTWLTK